MVTITKAHKIIILFVTYCVLTYILMNFLIQRTYDNNSTPDQGVFYSILKAIYYELFGLLGYLALINLTSIIGLIISIKRKDNLAVKAFKITTFLTVVVTILFILKILKL